MSEGRNKRMKLLTEDQIKKESNKSNGIKQQTEDVASDISDNEGTASEVDTDCMENLLMSSDEEENDEEKPALHDAKQEPSDKVEDDNLVQSLTENSYENENTPQKGTMPLPISFPKGRKSPPQNYTLQRKRKCDKCRWITVDCNTGECDVCLSRCFLCHEPGHSKQQHYNSAQGTAPNRQNSTPGECPEPSPISFLKGRTSHSQNYALQQKMKKVCGMCGQDAIDLKTGECDLCLNRCFFCHESGHSKQQCCKRSQRMTPTKKKRKNFTLGTVLTRMKNNMSPRKMKKVCGTCCQVAVNLKTGECDFCRKRCFCCHKSGHSKQQCWKRSQRMTPAKKKKKTLPKRKNFTAGERPGNSGCHQQPSGL